MVSGQYGLGKTLAIAFDLVGSLQGNGNTPVTQPSQLNSSWSALLADTLAYSTPAALTRALVPGELFSASFPLQNQGQATSLYADLSQPTGGVYISANETGTALGNGSEQFSLSLAQGQTLNLLTDQTAPSATGSYNLSLSAQTNATPPTSLGSYLYAFSVGPSQASRLTMVNSEINAISQTWTNSQALYVVRGDFSAAESDLSRKDYGDAIDALAEAGNNLALISGTQAAQARSDLDLLLKLVESEWVPGTPSVWQGQCGLPGY